jgi:hypothetical protein
MKEGRLGVGAGNAVGVIEALVGDCTVSALCCYRGRIVNCELVEVVESVDGNVDWGNERDQLGNHFGVDGSFQHFVLVNTPRVGFVQHIVGMKMRMHAWSECFDLVVGGCAVVVVVVVVVGGGCVVVVVVVVVGVVEIDAFALYYDLYQLE